MIRTKRSLLPSAAATGTVVAMGAAVAVFVHDSAAWNPLLAGCRDVWTTIAATHGIVLVHYALDVLVIAMVVRAVWFGVLYSINARRWQRIVANQQHPFAVTLGVLRPTTHISPALRRLLSAEQRRAVEVHEAWHKAHHDPARIALWRFASTVMFFLPIIRVWTAQALTELEVAADQAVLRAGIARRTLLSALRTVALASDAEPFGAAFAVRANMADRVAHLAGITQRRHHRGAVLVSLALLVGMLVPSLVIAHADVRTQTFSVCPAPQQSIPAPRSTLFRHTEPATHPVSLIEYRP